ncbi:type VI secretion system membrane subunit TssM [Parashewanella spongiae]|uniref:Type VI secretion system membrane subunit TssM n=1 Tax=Parashewanella spongiae TaxID=342950 RepID=A0A3A6U1K1_9GAMM|nr:type VI secretion system membrane subunit TssM [Parashewanella spongiae]MCL1076789.1 type VI secretion system membrane subunit TssM [Parashewanella spongiae]RJY19286.1 type VI secretion system membrane subunit TssM [Parashewanella spongiae]
MTLKKIILFLSIIVIIFSTALSWFFIGTESKFLWVRYTSLSVLIVSLLSIAVFFAFKKVKFITDKNKVEKAERKLVKLLFKSFIKKINGLYFGQVKLKSVYDIPWYLVIGSKDDDVNEFLYQNRLEKLSFENEALSQTEGYLSFWVSEQIIIIQVGDKIFDNVQVHFSMWKLLIKQVRRYRPRQGINGVLSVIACDRVLSSRPLDTRKNNELIKLVVSDLENSISLSVPVYFMFSKLDSLADFVEFMNYYVEKELEHPLGFTFNKKQKKFDKEVFQKDYQNFIRHVSEKKELMLFNINEGISNSIIALPYQLNFFFKIIEEKLDEVSKDKRQSKCVWIRGAYFFSCTHSNKHYDLLSQVLATKSDLETIEPSRIGRRNKEYFVSNLINQIILPEKSIIGINKRLNVAVNIGQVMLCVSLVFGGFLLKRVFDDNWKQDKAFRQLTLHNLKIYDTDLKIVNSKPSSLENLTFVLNQSRKISIEAPTNTPWYKAISFNQNQLSNKLHDSYYSQLKAYLLPKLIEMIGSELKSSIDLSKPTKTFNILRYYMMLFNVKNRKNGELVNYINQLILNNNSLDSDGRNRFMLLVNDLFSSNFTTNFSPSKELINLARSSFDGLSRDKLIYELIKKRPEFYNRVDIRHQFGGDFNNIFNFKPHYKNYMMPLLFTKQGYKKLNINPESSLLKEQLREVNIVTNSSERVTIVELAKSSINIRKMYFSEYIEKWKDVLSNISLNKFKTSMELSYALQILRDPSRSPLNMLIEAVVENTQLAKTKASNKTVDALTKKAGAEINSMIKSNINKIKPSLAVNNAFAEYATYYSKKSTVGTIENLTKSIDSLNNDFNSLLTDENPEQVMFKYAVAHTKGSQDSIKSLSNEVKAEPDNVQRWSKSLIDQIWASVLNYGVNYSKGVWVDKVYNFYYDRIFDHFPFSPQATINVSLADFKAFFAPNGILDSYIQTYILPFSSWQGGKLQLHAYNGRILPMSQHLLDEISKYKGIEQVFFNGVSNKLNLSFQIRAKYMDSDITKFEIRGNTELFNYMNGPREWSKINWPNKADEESISFNFYKDDNRVTHDTFSSEWSVLKPLLESKWSETDDSKIQLLTYSSKGHSISLDFSSLDSNVIFAKSLFTSFSLPPKL